MESSTDMTFVVEWDVIIGIKSKLGMLKIGYTYCIIAHYTYAIHVTMTTSGKI